MRPIYLIKNKNLSQPIYLIIYLINKTSLVKKQFIK